MPLETKGCPRVHQVLPITGLRWQKSQNILKAFSLRRSGARTLLTFYGMKSCLSIAHFYHTQLLRLCKLPIGLMIAPAAGRAWHHSHGCWTYRHAECWFEESWRLPSRFQSQTVLRAALSLWGGFGLGLGMSELLIVLILGLDWRTPLHCYMGTSFCDHSRNSDYELVSTVLKSWSTAGDTTIGDFRMWALTGRNRSGRAIHWRVSCACLHPVPLSVGCH